MKKKVLSRLIALACVISIAGLCSCDDKDSSSIVKTEPNGTIAKTEEPDESENQVSQAPEETTQAETNDQTQSTTAAENSSENESISPISSDSLASLAYSQTENFMKEMSDRGTPIEDSLNFEFILDDAEDSVDPKMSAEDQLKALIKQNAAGSGQGSRIYIGISEQTLFTQVKDSSGNITQYPASSGEITWGTFAQ